MAQATMLVIGVSSLAVAGVASWADRRRARRSHLDKVGFMPWSMLTILAILAALFAFAFAIKGGV